jgi:hypothetical protein
VKHEEIEKLSNDVSIEAPTKRVRKPPKSFEIVPR